MDALCSHGAAHLHMSQVVLWRVRGGEAHVSRMTWQRGGMSSYALSSAQPPPEPTTIASLPMSLQEGRQLHRFTVLSVGAAGAWALQSGSQISHATGMQRPCTCLSDPPHDPCKDLLAALQGNNWWTPVSIVMESPML
jgi:hypothetical protein